MVNKCVVLGCKSSSCLRRMKILCCHFPLDKAGLLQKWKQFVNQSNWTATKNSVICIKHFEEKFLLCGDKCMKLNWKLNPIPSIHTNEALKRPLTLQNLSVPCKAPNLRAFQEDELKIFNKINIITSFNDLTENCFLSEYTYSK